MSADTAPVVLFDVDGTLLDHPTLWPTQGYRYVDEPAVTDRPGAVELGRAWGRVQYRGVDFAYGGRESTLRWDLVDRFDPETGITGTAGVDVAWKFGQEGAMTSNCAMDAEVLLKDFDSVAQANMDWLVQRASQCGMGANGGIAQ